MALVVLVQTLRFIFRAVILRVESFLYGLCMVDHWPQKIQFSKMKLE